VARAITFDSVFTKAEKIKSLGHPLAAADLYRQSRSVAASDQEKKKAWFAEIKCYIDSGDHTAGSKLATDLQSEFMLSPIESMKLEAMMTFLKE
jgi:hypothetical protein